MPEELRSKIFFALNYKNNLNSSQLSRFDSVVPRIEKSMPVELSHSGLFKRKKKTNKAFSFGINDKEEKKKNQQHDWNNKAVLSVTASDLEDTEQTSKCQNL